MQGDFKQPGARAAAGSQLPGRGLVSQLGRELRWHAPFTLLGTLTAILIMVFFSVAQVPQMISAGLFWGFHPLHVLLSALVTTAMYALQGQRSLGATVAVGYLGSVGIATVSDCVIPYVAEFLLDLPNRGVHLGFIEKWWLVNPMAALGIAAGIIWPKTRLAHAGHVLISTWASLFHVVMASGGPVRPVEVLVIAIFLFLAVWIPCCTSDIVFPLLCCRSRTS